jgi:hypothetical protein
MEAEPVAGGEDQPMQTQEPAPIPEPTFAAPSIVHGGDDQPMEDQPMQNEEPAIDFGTDPTPALVPALVAQPPTTTQIALPAPIPRKDAKKSLAAPTSGGEPAGSLTTGGTLANGETITAGEDLGSIAIKATGSADA